MRWNESFSVGVAEIDEQHKKLVEMLGNLLEEMKRGRGKDVMANTINDMFNYAKMHFATEEKYMALYKYPESALHRREHEKFVETAKSFYEGYMNGSLSAIDLMNFLKNWLVEHILGSDKKLGKFVSGASLCKR